VGRVWQGLRHLVDAPWDPTWYLVLFLLLPFALVLTPLRFCLDKSSPAHVGLPLAVLVVILVVGGYLELSGKAKRLAAFRLPARPPDDADDPELKRLWADVCERYPEVGKCAWVQKGWDGGPYTPYYHRDRGHLFGVFGYGALSILMGCAMHEALLALWGVDLMAAGLVEICLARRRWVDYDDAVERLRVRMRDRWRL
jgi:hypothetical protein